MSIIENTSFHLASSQLFPLAFFSANDHMLVDTAAIMTAKNAYLLFQQGNLVAALEAYSLAIQQFPKEPFFYACRSILNTELGDEEGAFYDYQAAKGLDFHYHDFLEWIENRPEEQNPIARYSNLKDLLDVALAYTQQFDYEGALKCYTVALDEHSDQADIWVYQAAIYLRLLQYDKALIALNQALTLQKDHMQAYLFRGKLYKAIGANKKAKADYDRAVEVGQDVAVVYEERANFLVDLGLYVEALSDFNTLVDLLPEDFYIYSLRADLYEKLENWEAARDDYSKAITLNPYYSDLYAYRAEMKERLGDIAGAKEDRVMFDKLEQEE